MFQDPIKKIALICFCTLLLAGCSSDNPGNVEKIGAVLPLTGDAAQYGNWAKDGIDLAVRNVNESGGVEGKKFEVSYQDSQSDQNAGLNAFNHLLFEGGIQAVLIEYSGLVLAAAPIADRKGIVLMNIGALNPRIREAGDFVFSNINGADVEASKLADYAYDSLGIRSVALLYAAESYGVGNKDVFERRFQQRGGKVLASERFTANSADFHIQLAKIKSSRPDAVFVSAVTSDAAAMLSQAVEIGLRTIWLSTAFIEGEELLKLPSEVTDSLFYTSTVLDSSSGNREVQAFIMQFRQTYDRDPELYSGTAYDGAMILAKAIGQVGNDGRKIKQYLYSLRDYPGVSGITSFDKDGAVEKPVVLKTVRNNMFVKIGELK